MRSEGEGEGKCSQDIRRQKTGQTVWHRQRNGPVRSTGSESLQALSSVSNRGREEDEKWRHTMAIEPRAECKGPCSESFHEWSGTWSFGLVYSSSLSPIRSASSHTKLCQCHSYLRDLSESTLGRFGGKRRVRHTSGITKDRMQIERDLVESSHQSNKKINSDQALVTQIIWCRTLAGRKKKEEDKEDEWIQYSKTAPFFFGCWSKSMLESGQWREVGTELERWWSRPRSAGAFEWKDALWCVLFKCYLARFGWTRHERIERGKREDGWQINQAEWMLGHWSRRPIACSIDRLTHTWPTRSVTLTRSRSPSFRSSLLPLPAHCVVRFRLLHSSPRTYLLFRFILFLIF